MKTIRIIWTGLMLAWPMALMAQTGINFTSKPWGEVLEMAKEEDKYIFVDAYATWCGPCKYLKANVFPDEGLGDYYNGHFINVSYAIDKGEGQVFSEAYPVRAYPSLYFFTPEGELAIMEMGARDVPGMLALAERALDPGNHQYKLKEKYESGERSAKVVRGYLSMVEDEDKRREIMAGYVERLDAQAMSKEDKALVLENIEETDGPAFDFVLSHLRQFEGEEVEGMRVKELIVYLYTMDLGGLYLEEGGKGTEEMLAKAEEKAPGLAPSLHAMDRMLAVYVETEDPEQTYEQVLEDMDVLDDKYITMMFAISMFEDMGRRKNLIDIAAGEASPETMKKLYSDEIYRAKEVNPELMNELVGESAETYFWDDAASLNDFAWFMLDYPDQVGDYDLVLRMAERSVELDEDHYSLDTYARALYETGEKQKAVRMQEKAVRMAENDPEVSEAYVEGLQTALEKYKQ